VILLDTNVISELMKTAPDIAVDGWFKRNELDIALPTPALGEIAFGVAKLPDGKKREGLNARLVEWRMRLLDKTYPFASTTIMIYGDIMAEALSAKHNMSVADGQIAAIAAEHDCVLATRNIRDFKHISLALVNPWEAK
jgi:predicted nucleic acid-binding protein